jgi:hypothetical protein
MVSGWIDTRCAGAWCPDTAGQALKYTGAPASFGATVALAMWMNSGLRDPKPRVRVGTSPTIRS